MLPTRPVGLFLAALGGAFLLFARSPRTGFVYDEQEAILANPYLHGGHAWLDAFRLDFWGLPVEGTIGSYRPLTGLLWWPLAGTLRLQTPFFLQLLGPLLHAVAVFLLYSFLRRAMGSAASGSERGARLGAAALLMAGVATEAVTTVVGQADVLVAIWTLLALLSLELPLVWRTLAVFTCGLLGLLSKETMLGSLPLLCWAQLLLVRSGPRWTRLLGFFAVAAAGAASIAALVLVRRHFFLGDAEVVRPTLTMDRSWTAALVGLFEQPRLPVDPHNNPLAAADPAHVVPTALRIFATNVLQMLVPTELVGDYSFPRELPHGWTLGAVLGALALVIPLLGSLSYALARDQRGSSALLALGLAWVPLTYFPVSNLLVLLPTVRAERLLYTPLLGVCVVLCALWPRLERFRAAPRVLSLVLLTSALQARAHALHYESDVLFWRATSHGTPGSAKAHLNLGVMLGARDDPEGRVRATKRSVELSPQWPLGHVYLGDALCRSGKVEEALAHYVRGLELAPDQKDIAALSLQCLWDTGAFEQARPALERVAARDPRGWLSYLLGEVVVRGRENDGVPSEYRSHGYNQR